MTKLSRIGLIGDVHAEAECLEAALNFLHESNVDRILCVGDIVDGESDANKCCELLARADIAVVCGNHDRWFLSHQMRDLPEATSVETLSDKSKAFLASLPATRRFQTTAGDLLLCHGVGTNDMRRLTPDDFGYALEVQEELQELMAQPELRFVIGGHTHRRMVRQFGALTFINAGTLYQAHEPCLAIIDFDSNCLHFHNMNGCIVDAVGVRSELLI